MLTLNLLPKTEKEEIRREMKNIFLLDVWVHFVILTLIFLGLMFVSYFYARILLEPQKDIFAAEKDLSEKGDIQKLKDDISKTNKTIEDVYALEDGFYLFSPVLENLTALIPEGVYFKNIAVTKTGLKMSISGFAKDREAFLFLKKTLDESGQFSEVYSPISNLLQPTDIDFSLTLTLK